MRRRALLAAALVTAVHALVATAAGADRAPPPLSKLLARHAPIVVLQQAERFRPVSVDGFLADSDVTKKTDGGWETVGGPLPRGGANLRLNQRYCNAIEGVSASPCYASAQAAHGSTPVVYGKAFRLKNRIDLQYWFWYPYNDYSPTVPAGDIWQVHEGDWEAVSVILDSLGRPLLAGYSQHGEGKRRAWRAVPKRGSRPIVYVALGSHANYFGPATRPLDRACWPKEALAVFDAYEMKPVDRAARGRTVAPRVAPVRAASPGWMRYRGAWGEAQYVGFPNIDPITYGAGPQGPAFHDAWRTPIRSLLEWPVG